MNTIITIGRELGSGGRTIGRTVAIFNITTMQINNTFGYR